MVLFLSLENGQSKRISIWILWLLEVVYRSVQHLHLMCPDVQIRFISLWRSKTYLFVGSMLTSSHELCMTGRALFSRSLTAVLQWTMSASLSLPLSFLVGFAQASLLLHRVRDLFKRERENHSLLTYGAKRLGQSVFVYRLVVLSWSHSPSSFPVGNQ